MQACTQNPGKGEKISVLSVFQQSFLFNGDLFWSKGQSKEWAAQIDAQH